MHVLNQRVIGSEVHVTKGVQRTQNQKREEGLEIQIHKKVENHHQMMRETEEKRERWINKRFVWTYFKHLCDIG